MDSLCENMVKNIGSFLYQKDLRNLISINKRTNKDLKKLLNINLIKEIDNLIKFLDLKDKDKNEDIYNIFLGFKDEYFKNEHMEQEEQEELEQLIIDCQGEIVYDIQYIINTEDYEEELYSFVYDIILKLYLIYFYTIKN